MKFIDRWLTRRAQKRQKHERLLRITRRAGISYRARTAEEAIRWA